MRDQMLHTSLSTVAAEAVPDTTDLWPAISRRLADRGRPVRRGLDRRRIGLATTAALVLVVGWALVGRSLPGQSSTALAADLARHDPQVEAILRGDVSIVTVTSVVDEVATVVVEDSHGQKVTVTVDLRSRIVTKVYQGPQLSPELRARATALVRADPRTSALLDQGAALGPITPIFVTHDAIDPVTGVPTQGTETWAQVPLDLSGQEWVAYVDLVQGRIDQLVDPHGSLVPLP
jgi:hypothetical protein